MRESAGSTSENAGAQLRDGRGVLVADAAWPEVERRLRRGAVAVLPIGAASKEHGFHLPLGTDYLQAQWLAGKLTQELDVVVWPTLSYGYYPVFVDYPGSSSLERDTFIRVVREILSGIARAGAGRTVLVNTGISTIEPLQAVIEQQPDADGVLLVNVYSGPAFGTAVAELEEQAWGGHADEIETSIMLAIAPRRVDMHKAEAALTRIERGMFNRRDPRAANYSPSGVNGNPTLASRDKGLQLTQALWEDVRVAIEAFADAGGEA